MRLEEARTLRPGDQVLVEDACGATHRGVVIHATAKGGVLVQANGGEAWAPFPKVHWPEDAAFVRRVSKALFRR